MRPLPKASPPPSPPTKFPSFDHQRTSSDDFSVLPLRNSTNASTEPDSPSPHTTAPSLDPQKTLSEHQVVPPRIFVNPSAEPDLPSPSTKNPSLEIRRLSSEHQDVTPRSSPKASVGEGLPSPSKKKPSLSLEEKSLEHLRVTPRNSMHAPTEPGSPSSPNHGGPTPQNTRDILADPELATQPEGCGKIPHNSVSIPTATLLPLTPSTCVEVLDASNGPPGLAQSVKDLWNVLAVIIQKAGYSEVWGVELDPANLCHVSTQIILTKFLNVNNGDVEAANQHLTKTLEWRSRWKPLQLLERTFRRSKFDGLGGVTHYFKDGMACSNTPAAREIFIWITYGVLPALDATFDDLDDFITWRVALMELALQTMNLAAATEDIMVCNDPYWGSSATIPLKVRRDPYQITQVHDWKGTSFFKKPQKLKVAMKEVDSVFKEFYPGLFKNNYFINVPLALGFVFPIVKCFTASKKVREFHPISNGKALANEVKSWYNDEYQKWVAEQLPKAYGGKGIPLEEDAELLRLTRI